MMEDLRALNNCEVFNQIRIELTRYHREKKKLNSFAYFSGNKENINDLCQLVLNVLLEHGLVQQLENEDRLQAKPSNAADLDQLRGILMYLILNSANVGSGSDTELGRCNPQCVHLLNLLPEPLPQFVTISLALSCGLEQQLAEFLACGSYWLTSQYFDCFIETLTPLVTVRRAAFPLICGALSAVTKAICYHEAAGEMSLRSHAMRLLQRHLLDTEIRLDTLQGTSLRHRYLGEIMSQLLDVILEAVRAVKQRPQLPAYLELYALRAPKSIVKLEPGADTEDANAKLRCFAGSMMDAVQRLLPLISIDCFMTWHELPSSMLLFSLQAHVSNQSKQLLDLLAEDEQLAKHSLRPQLDNFGRGAQSFEQRLTDLKLGELLGLLDGEMGVLSEEQLLKALEQLLQRDVAFGSDECVETMAKHVQLMKPAHVLIIYQHMAKVVQAKQFIKQEIKDEEEQDEDEDEPEHLYADLLRQIVLPIFQACPDVEHKLHLLVKREELQLLQLFNFEQEDYDSRRHQFFNQLFADIARFPLAKFLDLCFEQPAQTWLALAQLGMSHPRFAGIYCHVAVQCAAHAMHHVPFTVSQIMLNEHVLTETPTQSPNQFQLLLKLYEQPVILNGMCYRQVIKTCRRRLSRVWRNCRIRELNLNLNVSSLPYTGAQLQAAQDNYLNSLAAGLGKFTEQENYPALEKLLRTLLNVGSVENRLLSCSRRGLQLQRQLLRSAPTERAVKQARQKLQLARDYVALHSRLGFWRLEHWTLVSQLIRTMDHLRGNLANYEQSRMRVLDLIILYYVNNVPRAYLFCPGLDSKVLELVKSLQHKHLWKDEHLAMLLSISGKPVVRKAKQYAMLLAQASSLEATKLLNDAIQHKIDQAVMVELAKAVDEISSHSALNAYGFVFKCYMRSFKESFIKRATSKDYPALVEHLLNTPKMLVPENLLSAVDNFKILLNVEKEIVLQFVNIKFTEPAGQPN